jgi:membrane-bound serine protease (ClpP class)
MGTLKLMLFVFALWSGLWSLISGPPALFGADDKAGNPRVYTVDVDGTINPAVEDFIASGIDKAEANHAAAFIIRMDTPGGVLETTKTIIKKMTNARVPVVVYVAPSGSSAASAGALITMAADVAAMAPGTNIGAAHPVGGVGQEINSTMSEKIVNDLTAYMKAIIASKGRNAEWVESAIKESASITADEALRLKVIDLMADSVPELLSQLNGRTIEKNRSSITLETKDAEVVRIPSGWRFKILDAIANPNVAYILMMIGTLGIIVELYHPGAILPGVAGGICLFLAFFALQVLPVNYVGILLIILAIILFIVELKVPSYGLLSIGAIISLTLGSVMLFKTDETGMRVSWTVIVPTVSVVSAFFIFALGLVAKARLNKPRTGQEELMGEIGLAVTDIETEGRVSVLGEYWNARADGHIAKGERVRVIRVDNLCLVVTRDVT